MDKNKTLWEFFISDYSNKTLLPVSILELIAIYPVVKLCAEGISNMRISKRLDFPIRYVEDILIDYLDFSGWDLDLDFSPIAMYSRSNKNFDIYYYEVYTVTPVALSNRFINLSFNICTRFIKIKEKLKEYGYES